MDNQKDKIVRIVRGEDRFAGSPNNDLLINVNLEGERKNLVEGDRTTILDLQQRFDDERQKSTNFRIYGKVTNIFYNDIILTSSYENFENVFFYVNAGESALDEYNNPGSGVWSGYPQYNEFSFYRPEGIKGHIPYVTKSAGTYNWAMYVTYPYENVYDQRIRHRVDFPSGSTVNNFEVSEGVPYYILNETSNGKRLLTFYCGYKHNLKEGEWIQTKDEIEGKRYFQVYRLGNKSYGNEETVFSIYNYGFTDPLFGNYSIGIFKRVIDINNTGETTSQYYVRRHKVLTNLNDVEVTKMGFENNPFPLVKQLEYSASTPDNVQRVSTKEGTQSYGYSFEKDIDISPLIDNQKRPITKLYVTIINKGYMGWFNNPYYQTNDTGIQVGWDLNFLSDNIDTWWSISNVDNRDTIPNDSYQLSGETFYFNSDFNTGDTLNGSICEFNEWEQKEFELNEINHKISFNPQILFSSGQPNLPDGYTYKPHYPMDVRVFSDYVEKGDKDNVENIPNYSFLSEYNKEWRWRDLYPYGFIDTDGNGVDNPFMNNNHYIFNKINFLISPMKKNQNNYNNIIIQPNQDDCE